ncbi:MAG: cyclodeaminase/cyclohydrolase family protein [Deltaproteobacteria bacterium]|nr:cyclodeaminase/cyclohydrolase family protein [Deltaproteobacteria bacterium]
MTDIFIKTLSNPKKPVPGGGAAAAHAALVGLALLEKIVRVEHQRCLNDPEMAVFWENLLARVLTSTDSLHQLRDEDGKRYMHFVETKSAGKSRHVVLEAIQQVIDCPVKIMEESHEALGLVLPAGKHCKRHLLSDLLVVGELLRAASRGACWIVQANLQLPLDLTLKTDYPKKLTRLNDDRHYTFKRRENAVRERMNRQ